MKIMHLCRMKPAQWRRKLEKKKYCSEHRTGRGPGSSAASISHLFSVAQVVITTSECQGEEVGVMTRG